MYKNVENISCNFIKQEKVNCCNKEQCVSNKNEGFEEIYIPKNNLKTISKKKQMLLGWFFVCLVFFNVCGICLKTSSVGYYIKNIVASWAPKNVDIGKIKFVNTTDKEDFLEVVSLIDLSFVMPFSSGYATQNEKGQIFVNGNGEIMVVCCYNSKVTKIETINSKRAITFDCGYNVSVVYLGLDNIGVKVGNKLKKGQSVGTCNKSLIEIKVLYKGKVFDKIKVKNGKISIF